MSSGRLKLVALGDYRQERDRSAMRPIVTVGWAEHGEAQQRRPLTLRA